jgi:hypothetical protein
MSIGVLKVGEEFQCVEYDLNGTNRKNSAFFGSPLELKFHLLSIPSPPKKEILEFINSLSKAKQ